MSKIIYSIFDEKIKLVSPVSYQGGKQKIANQIVKIIKTSNKDQKYVDICCGSGSISLELINQGVSPSNIFMIDQGPWGLFWESISKSTFDLNKFKNICNNVPSDLFKIKKYMEDLSKTEVDEDAVYTYLLLQSASFGSKSIWIKNNKWVNCSFRDYWMPTESSNRKYSVNPMMPMPNTLYERVKCICENAKGILAYYSPAEILNIYNDEYILYIDPPYKSTTSYGHEFNILEFIKDRKNVIYVSEGEKISDKSYLINSGSKKGGISGKRGKIHEEWLNRFN